MFYFDMGALAVKTRVERAWLCCSSLGAYIKNVNFAKLQLEKFKSCKVVNAITIYIVSKIN